MPAMTINQVVIDHKAPRSAFAIRNLGVLMLSGGFTMWHYKQGDASFTEIAAPDFFNDASDMVHAGDVIVISGGEGATQRVVRMSHDGRVATGPMTVVA